ncbi:WGR domain-containing protein [Nannocystis bainbridge]|uniref:WGR domain-containing protein n=1 Tax=Nannocystis bainbridge TaxID=2995303 RepID=A0ABT5DR88_9BACT|nr:WGR domain-containing protein [Nannocystis bainbridge]MDC0716172.1 WGR domain-containing protein [Nannocystis bainbridge]
MAATRRFEFVEGTSKKFWEVTVEGDCMTVCFGRVGTAGSAKDKTFGDADEAQRQASKLIAEKTKKGYVETTTTGPSEPAAPSVAGATSAPASHAPKAGASKAPAAKAAAQAPRGASGSPPVDAFLEALRKKHKQVAAQLRPAASEDLLKVLRGHEVPATLLAIYTAHDGTEAELFDCYRLLPIAEIEKTRSMMNGILAEKPEWRQKAGAWTESWVPFMADGDGQLYCFDPTGSLDGGTPGQILFYDHETGAGREFTSFDVFLELLTALAKKGLLDQETREEDEELQEKYDELYANAKNVGLPKMPAKELKKALKAIGELKRANEKLALALPLARKHPAEADLWCEVMSAAEDLNDWSLAAEAGATAERLTPSRDRPRVGTRLATALHKLGRDEQAFAMVVTALSGNEMKNYPANKIPTDVSPAFRHRCLKHAVESFPNNLELWWQLGSEAPTPEERASALNHLIALCSDEKLIRFNEHRAQTIIRKARAVLESDRVDTLEGAAKVKDLIALARSIGEIPSTLTDRWAETSKAVFWDRAVAYAIAQGDWQAAREAGAGLLEALGSDHTHHLGCQWHVLALHRLGRDAEALASLRTALDAMWDKESAEAVRAVPWNDYGDPPLVERGPTDAAFEAACYSLAVEVQPDNVFAWAGHARTARSASERKAALEKVVALCVPELVDFVEDPELPAHVYEYHRKRSAAFAANETKRSLSSHRADHAARPSRALCRARRSLLAASTSPVGALGRARPSTTSASGVRPRPRGHDRDRRALRRHRGQKSGLGHSKSCGSWLTIALKKFEAGIRPDGLVPEWYDRRPASAHVLGDASSAGANAQRQHAATFAGLVVLWR